MPKVLQKSILRISFRLASPLVLGSGKSSNTDNDLIRNNDGNPYIPGTAVAGVIRSLMENEQNGSGLSESDKRKYFGFVPTYEQADNGEEALSSAVLFYDANLNNNNNYHVSKRDSVSLDKWKTAEKGKKFDMEVLEPGAEFLCYIEQNFYNTVDMDCLSLIAGWWKSGCVRFGAKTMRGFGSIDNVIIDRIDIHFNNSEETWHWLDHDMYDAGFWTDDFVSKDIEAEAPKNKEYALKLKLKVDSALSIRKYTTEPTKENDLVSQPDYEQLTLHNGTPVIPGTTWAGAFRSNMRRLIPGLNEDYFGAVNPKGKIKVKSGILFSESMITGSKPKLISRNAIDRFSGGTITGALYTEKTSCGGTTELEIRFCNGRPDDDMLIALAASVADLHAGILSVGGLTAVGRGLFKVIEINGGQIPDDAETVYAETLKSLNNMFGEKESEATK